MKEVVNKNVKVSLKKKKKTHLKFPSLHMNIQYTSRKNPHYSSHTALEDQKAVGADLFT